MRCIASPSSRPSKSSNTISPMKTTSETPEEVVEPSAARALNAMRTSHAPGKYQQFAQKPEHLFTWAGLGANSRGPDHAQSGTDGREPRYFVARRRGGG